MEETKKFYLCLNCNRSETKTPLVNLRYAGKESWICTQCLPLLIHQPEQIADKIAAAGQTSPSTTQGD